MEVEKRFNTDWGNKSSPLSCSIGYNKTILFKNCLVD